MSSEKPMMRPEQALQEWRAASRAVDESLRALSSAELERADALELAGLAHAAVEGVSPLGPASPCGPVSPMGPAGPIGPTSPGRANTEDGNNAATSAADPSSASTRRSPIRSSPLAGTQGKHRAGRVRQCWRRRWVTAIG
jgi:hypothetical protein